MGVQTSDRRIPSGLRRPDGYLGVDSVSVGYRVRCRRSGGVGVRLVLWTMTAAARDLCGSFCVGFLVTMVVRTAW